MELNGALERGNAVNYSIAQRIYVKMKMEI